MNKYLVLSEFYEYMNFNSDVVPGVFIRSLIDYSDRIRNCVQSVFDSGER